MRRPTSAAVALLAAFAVCAPDAAGAADLQDRKPRGPWLSKHAGWTVWSEKVNGSYALLARSKQTTKLLPAPVSPITHDPGAGRGPDGRPAALYQRCVRAECSIWLVDLARGSQRRVKGLGEVRRVISEPSDDDFPGVETHPRLWGSRVAFKTGGSKGRSRLRVGSSVTGRGTIRTIPARPGDDGGSLMQLAVGPDHVVALWEDVECFGRCIGLYIYGIASGRQKEIDDARGTAECTAFVDNVRYDGAFRWTRELLANEPDDTCSSKVTRLRYDTRTGRTGS